MNDTKWEWLLGGSPEALSDLLAIVDYISDDNPAAAQTLKEDIETGVSNLRVNPRLYGAGRMEGTREMVVRSNYIVVYAEDVHTVTVLRVLHGAQLWPRP